MPETEFKVLTPETVLKVFTPETMGCPTTVGPAIAPADTP
jgi:hypothetical protein